MSLEDIKSKLAVSLENSTYSLGQPVELIFEGFDANKLVQADNQVGGKLFGIVVRVALKMAERRLRKFPNHRKKTLLISDFVPALSYLQDVSRRSDLSKIRKSDAKTIAPIKGLIKSCCPWCTDGI